MMETGTMIVAIVGVLAAMVLVGRGLHAQHLSFERKATMAGIWVVVIVVLVMVIKATGLEVAR